MKKRISNPKFDKAFNDCLKAIEKLPSRGPNKIVLNNANYRMTLSLGETFQQDRYMREYIDSLSM